MKRIGVILLGLFLCFCLVGQSIEETKNFKLPELKVENFPSEEIDVLKSPVCCFFQRNFDCPSGMDPLIYEGTVVVEFRVNKDGTISNVNIENSRWSELDLAILECLNSTSGNWVAGSVNDVPVSMSQKFFIRFDAPGNPTHEEIARDHLRKAQELFEKAGSYTHNGSKQKRLYQRAGFQLAYAMRYKPQADDVCFWDKCLQQHLYKQDVEADRFEEILSPDGLIAEPDEILYVMWKN